MNNCTANTARLNSALADLRESLDRIEGYVDVTDGPYGTQLPNSAMVAQALIETAIAKLEMNTCVVALTGGE